MSLMSSAGGPGGPGGPSGHEPHATQAATSAEPVADAPTVKSVLVVGAGLIGTSVGLALREVGIDVALEDRAAGRLALAVELGAGRPRHADDVFDVAIAAVPPKAIPAELLRLQSLGIARTISDVGSAKAEPLAQAEALGVDSTRYVGGHPVAGRERSGPAAAHSDLFVGRPWVLTPAPKAAADAIADVRAVALACGAVPVQMDADEHDAALATVSHLPHLVASLLAGQLVASSEATVALGGTGLHDTTRVAAGDAALWTEILAANADHLATALAAFAEDVAATVTALQRVASGDLDAVQVLTDTLRAGVAGRARVPLKRGETAAGFVAVPIVVRDAPGELAALLRALGDAGINVEDVRVEHEPGRPVGVVEIDVREDVVPALISCMRESGWQVYS